MGSMGLAGQSGAATTSTTAAPSAAHAAAKPASGRTPAVCSGGKSRFKPGHQGKGFARRAAKLEAKEAKAKAAGHTKRAAYLAKMIAHDEAVASRLGKHYAHVEGRISAFVAAKCGTSH
jgi:hypothetical protein